MTDREMRGILIEYLMIKNRHYRIFQEKNIGSSVCDVMLVTDRLCGFEIKSDSDNFERIGRQVEAYERFFDENTIVVGEKYRDTAAKKVPACGVRNLHARAAVAVKALPIYRARRGGILRGVRRKFKGQHHPPEELFARL